jgi:hypothetical protein
MLSDVYSQKRQLLTEKKVTDSEVFTDDPVFKRFKRYHELREWKDISDYGFPSGSVDTLTPDEICQDMIAVFSVDVSFWYHL